MLLYQPFCQSERGKLHLSDLGGGWIGELNLDRIQSPCISVQSSLFQSYTQGTQTMHSRHVAYVHWINKDQCMDRRGKIGRRCSGWSFFKFTYLLYNCVWTLSCVSCHHGSSFSFLLHPVQLHWYSYKWWLFVYKRLTNSCT